MNKLKFIKALTRNPDISWYKMQASENVADIYIYDEINPWGIQADQFVKELNALQVSTIRLHMNTPGGSVFDGIAIYNALKQHKAKVETYIEGVAASIGSLVALAGDKVYMAENSFFMIHEPWILAIGDATELRKMADLLDKMSDTLINTYVAVTEQKVEQVKQWLKDETWFTAKEAKDAGFIDEITEKIDTQNSHDLSDYNNVPKELLTTAKKEPSNSTLIRESMRRRLELENANI